MDTVFAIEQPAGLRGFGWGLLGYFGANAIMNATQSLGAWLITPLIGYAEGWGVLAFPIIALAFYFGVLFKNSRAYTATATGASWAIALQAVIYFFQFTLAVGLA